MGLMRRQEEAEGVVANAVQELEGVAVQGLRLVPLPSLDAPVVEVDGAVEVVGMEVVAAPVLEPQPVAPFGYVVGYPRRLRKGSRVQVPLADPGGAVSGVCKGVAKPNLIVPRPHEVDQMARCLRVAPRDQH